MNPLAGRNQDLLADNRCVGEREGKILDAAAKPLVAAPERVAHRVEIVDVALDDRVPGQGLNGVALDTIHAAPPLGDLYHLDRRGTDVGAQERRHLGLEQALQRIEAETEFSFKHR